MTVVEGLELGWRQATAVLVQPSMVEPSSPTSTATSTRACTCSSATAAAWSPSSSSTPTNSQQVKDDTHLDYERARDTAVPVSERAALIEKMTARWADVPAPPGLTELTSLGGCPVTPKNYAPRKITRGRDA
ncbi:hypothetical protein [Rhodococcus triatomae]